MKKFNNKILLITGGTGSFGNAVLRKFLNSNLKEVRIFSRDEKKQDDMRRKFNHPKLKFFLGDVREQNSLIEPVRGSNFIFHAAALKQVPSCEFHPMEAVKTNVLGTENLLNAAIQERVEKVICLSTDKAVYPINAMGTSKAMMEKIILAKSRSSDKTKICITRYGNVMASRGSVIPLFINQVFEKKPITITDPEMTRFMMTLEDAVDLVLFAFEKGKSGEIYVQKSPAATVKLLAECISEIMGNKDHKIKIIGTRHGEKIHETLLSREEYALASDLGQYYSIPKDSRDLNYEAYFDKGDAKISKSEDYNSSNTIQLNKNNLTKLLFELPFMEDVSKGLYVDPVLE